MPLTEFGKAGYRAENLDRLPLGAKGRIDLRARQVDIGIIAHVRSDGNKELPGLSSF
jgi:hypothetical protein